MLFINIKASLQIMLDPQSSPQPATTNQNINLNQILILSKKNKQGQQNITIYLPTYFRFLVKNVLGMDFQNLCGSINVTFLVAIYVKHIPTCIKEQLKKNIILFFSRDGPLKLSVQDDKNQTSISEKNDYIHFTIRKIVETKLEPYVFFTPFEIIDHTLTVEFRKLEICENFVIKFNLMDAKSPKELQDQHRSSINQSGVFAKNKKIKEIRYNFYPGCGFGQYVLAEKRMAIQYDSTGSASTLMKLQKNFYKIACLDQRKQKIEEQNQKPKKEKKAKKISQTNSEKQQLLTKQEIDCLRKEKYQDEYDRLLAEDEKKKKKDDGFKKKQKYYQYAHIHIPLYRKPAVVLGTIFIPVWLLGIINLSIFYQEPGLGERITNIAALMTVFIAIIPDLRQKLPRDPKISMIELTIYAQILTEFLSLIHSLRNRDASDEDYANFNSYQDTEYLISLILTVLIILLPTFSLIFNACYFVPRHHFKNKIEKQSTGSFDKKEWVSPDQEGQWTKWVKRQNLCIEEEEGPFMKKIKEIEVMAKEHKEQKKKAAANKKQGKKMEKQQDEKKRRDFRNLA